MHGLIINDLTFLDRASSPKIFGARATRRITPTVSTAAATGADTRATTFASIDGDLLTGFRFNVRARGSAASAQASAVSIGGTATANVIVSAG
jgi:hypothetical protein